jgi:hypothetical protein
MIRRIILFILLIAIITSGSVFANTSKSITIKHIGETDRLWEVLVINTKKDGFLLDEFIGYHYFAVREDLFGEIVDLCNRNRELLREKEANHEYGKFELPEYGSFELYVENEEKTESYYLVNRDNSMQLLKKLLELIKTRRGYNKLIHELGNIIRRLETVAIL